MDRKIGSIDATKFFGAGIHVNQLDFRRRAIEKRIPLRRDFPEPPAYEHDQISGFNLGYELRIRAQPQVSCITRMQRVEQRSSAITGGDGRTGTVRKFFNLSSRLI